MDLKLEELDVLSEMIGQYLQEKNRHRFREKEERTRNEDVQEVEWLVHLCR